MVLLDSLYSYNKGGGKILLDYLVEFLESKNIDTFYLFDKRCKESYTQIPNERKVFLDASLKKRYLFYASNKSKFQKVVCFSNIPPLSRLDCEVFTYLHQSLYLNIPLEFSFVERIKFRMKHCYLRMFKKNSDFWLVQNFVMQKGLVKKYKIENNRVLLLPFYPNEDLIPYEKNRESNTFIFVSNPSPHKNHQRLLEAFVRFYDEHKIGELIVTVNSSNVKLYDEIKELQNKGYPVKNLGYVGREELIRNYQRAEYLIFPSLEESFGLGIVEAIECGCKVVGADLPYMYEACQPSISFNPFDVEDIKNAFLKAVQKNEIKTEQRIYNEIEKMLLILLE